MVPTPALRETIILVIFGIILVPIAAKRAQDAPGYWKAFNANTHQSLLYNNRQSWTSALMLMTAGDNTRTSDLPIKPSKIENETASVDSVPVESRLEPKRPLTIRLRLSTSETAIHATMTEVDVRTEATEMPVSTDGEVAVRPSPTTTSAANRERWTLIWAGTAIAAVALFMSFC
ncbi:hypothetical protein Daus18300_000261 [Diaporthe australafricana]|uniref:Uncharacterized protein n=1 Tax=Diaporthe australafricana TaxID=127596 RepID=A0ABR3Y580_9PEZI